MASLIRRPLFSSRPQLTSLLNKLHALSLAQEVEHAQHKGNFNPKDTASAFFPKDNDAAERNAFKEKLVALDQDKASSMYLILRAMNAQRMVEAGTSFGISTMYLLAALRDNVSQHKQQSRTHLPKVWGTELEHNKVLTATSNFQKAFSDHNEWDDIKKKDQLEILEGDILQTLPAAKFPANSLDAILLDIWAGAARPTLETLTPAARPGAVLFIDNATSSAERYRDLNEFLSTPENGWASVVMPFTNGLELAVKVEQ